MTNYLETGFMPDEGCGQRLEPLEYDYTFKAAFPTQEAASSAVSAALGIIEDLRVRPVRVERSAIEDKELDLKVHFGDLFLRSELLKFQPHTQDIVSLMANVLMVRGGSVSITETDFEGLVSNLKTDLTPGAKVLARELSQLSLDLGVGQLCQEDKWKGSGRSELTR